MKTLIYLGTRYQVGELFDYEYLIYKKVAGETLLSRRGNPRPPPSPLFIKALAFFQISLFVEIAVFQYMNLLQAQKFPVNYEMRNMVIVLIC